MSEIKRVNKPSPALAELLLAPSLEELQNAVLTGRLSDEQFCNFWRRAATQAQLRGNVGLLRKLLRLLDSSPARLTEWGQLLAHQYGGLLSLSEGNFEAAIGQLLAQRQTAWGLADATELTLANLELAQASLVAYRLEDARRYLLDAEHWSNFAREPALLVRLLNRQAELAAQRHLTEQSLKIANKALQLALQYRLRLEQAVAYNRLGVSYTYLREWEQAAQNLNEALRLRQTVRDGLGQADTLLNMAALEVRRDQPQIALGLVDRGLTMMEKLENPFGLGQALYQKALLLHKSGQHAAALSWATRAVKLRTAQAEPTRLAQAHGLLGRLLTALDQPQAALTNHLKVLELYRPEYTNPQWVDVLVDAGDYLIRAQALSAANTQHWQQAYEAYRAAITIIEHNQNLYYLAGVLGRMARALLRLEGVDGLPEAVRCYQLQLNLLGDISSTTVPPEEAIAQRAEALTGLQICASLQRRRQA